MVFMSFAQRGVKLNVMFTQIIHKTSVFQLDNKN